ncbi:MAG: histidine kinase [Bacteroidota bacterium]
MQNIFASERYQLGYIITWVFVGSFYASMLGIIWKIPFMPAIVDAFVFTAFFGIMGIALWYIAKFSGLDSANLFNTIATHLVAGAILVFTVVMLGETILKYINLHNSGFYDFSSEQHIFRLIGGGLIYVFTAVNFYMIIYYEEYRSRKIRQTELGKSLKTAELNMLKAQINPHFIFNSLNSVSSLTLTDPKRAHEMVIQLSDFLRYSIRKNADQLVTLEQEIEAINLFLAIEKIRYGDRLGVNIKCNDETLQLKLPALILQPLIENAIKYSLYETDKESEINIECSRQEGSLLLKIINTYDADAVINKGEGIGLKNVRSRMNLVYNRIDLLETNKNDSLFKVTLTVPQDEKD